MRNSIDAINSVATLSGGAALPQSEFAASLPASIPAIWVGAILLPLGLLLLLSPLTRVWSPLPRRGRDLTRATDEPEGDADLEAALDASGMEMGSPTAQRPAGRILQIRAMRPGDAPNAARKVDWGYFLDDVVEALGSSLMPKVLETPRLESLSILTLLDLHKGADARDTGGYADRIRAMARIATINALIASRRNGVHTVLSLQSLVSRDELEVTGDITDVIGSFVADKRAHSRAQLPEL